MIKEAIGTAESIAEATEQAKMLLNAPDTADVQFDVLEHPTKKMLGLFGGTKAKVRAYYECPDEAEKPAKKVGEKKQVKKSAPKPQKAEEKAVKKETADIPEYGEPVGGANVDPESASGKAVKYLTKVISALGCNDVAITVREREGATLLSLEGEGLGVVIGRHGETLDSLQYLTSLAANVGNGYHKVTIDIGDFRARREQTLTDLAKRVANQALRTGRNRSLEPMNPYERRIIHTAVQEIEGVSSHSVGDGTSRHVVITVPGGENRSHPGRDRRGPRQTRTVVAPTENREPKKDSEAMPLYGKIN